MEIIEENNLTTLTDRTMFPLFLMRNSLFCLKLVLGLDLGNFHTVVIVDIRLDIGDNFVGLIIEILLAVERRRPRQGDHVLAEITRGDGRVIVVILVDDVNWNDLQKIIKK